MPTGREAITNFFCLFLSIFVILWYNLHIEINKRRMIKIKACAICNTGLTGDICPKCLTNNVSTQQRENHQTTIGIMYIIKMLSLVLLGKGIAFLFFNEIRGVDIILSVSLIAISAFLYALSNIVLLLIDIEKGIRK